MAEFDAQRVPAALLFGAVRGCAGRMVKKPCAALPEVPLPPEIQLPEYWNSFTEPGGGYVGPLMGQMFLAVGHGSAFDGAVLRIGGAVLVGAAGKVFAFASWGSAGLWVEISKARAIREVELAQGMVEEKRGAWLAVKRAALEKAARNRINAAARVSDQAIAAALIADADFALRKWEHYA